MNHFVFSYRKASSIFQGMFVLVRKHKYYFFAPLLILLAMIALLVYHVGPSVVIAFIYAGV